MVPLGESPDIVQPDAPFCASVFASQALEQFQRDISGVIVAEHTTVEGIHRLLVLQVRHQRSLTRLFTESPFSVRAGNRGRLALGPSLPSPQRQPHGVRSLDETVWTHEGHHFDPMAYLYDAAPPCEVWAPHLVPRPDRDDQPASPLAFRLGEPADVETIATGLTAAGMTLRPRTWGRKDDAPKTWRP